MKGGTRLRSGHLRGRVLPVPDGVRPTESRVREAFFDIVGDRIAQCRFLDLFAGSGAVGLEAVSRGAAEVMQVDSSAAVLRALRTSYRRLGVAGISCRRLELPRQLGRLTAPVGGYDWIFADPPYGFSEYRLLLAGLPRLLGGAGLAVLEHDSRQPPQVDVGALERIDLRTYGECALSFYRPLEVDSPR